MGKITWAVRQKGKITDTELARTMERAALVAAQFEIQVQKERERIGRKDRDIERMSEEFKTTKRKMEKSEFHAKMFGESEFHRKCSMCGEVRSKALFSDSNVMCDICARKLNKVK